MFEIKIEWEEAPGVAEPLLARTWARLEFRLDGRPMTRYFSERTNAIRDGVYGSVFPLAEWITSHWWALLNEGPRSSSVTARTERIQVDGTRQWLRRHNLLTCREGMAYPDLAIFRKDAEMMLQWFPDPDTTTTHGRFLGRGLEVVSRAQVEETFASVVVTVLERLEGFEHESAEELVELWSAISDSRRHEIRLCERLGMLGQDPYDEGLDDVLEHIVEGLTFPNELTMDLLSASSPGTLKGDVGDTRSLLDSLSSSGTHASRPITLAAEGLAGYLPFKVGYARASVVRNHLGVSDDEPLSNLPDLLGRIVGETRLEWVDQARHDIEAAVQVNGVAALAASNRSPRAKRFLLGRALHHWLYVTTDDSQRLLTTSHDWVQAASRAFAAELLAPANALATRLANGPDWERREELAEEFDVSPMVINHQVDNNRLG